MIPEADYAKIHELMPIICIDVVVSIDRRVLLIQRTKEPALGMWWFPGGRLFKGESIDTAAGRIVKAETNLSLIHTDYVGKDETMFPTDPFGHGKGTHTVNLVYSGNLRETSVFNLVLDGNHSGYQLIDRDDIMIGDYHDYVKKFVAMTQF